MQIHLCIAAIAAGAIVVQPTIRKAIRLPPGPGVNRTLHQSAMFSDDGMLIEGVMILEGWWRGPTPSLSADIRWNGIESLRGGMIIIEQWTHFQLCSLLEDRKGERVRCIIIHQVMGMDASLVVAGEDGRECHRRAAEWMAGRDDTSDVGAVTIYFEMGES